MRLKCHLMRVRRLFGNDSRAAAWLTCLIAASVLLVTTVADLGLRLLTARPPYENPGALVRISEYNLRLAIPQSRVSPASVVTWEADARQITAVAAMAPARLVSLQRGGRESQLATCSQATPNWFQLLGVRAARGRLFDAYSVTDRSTPPRTVVVSHALWQTALGAEPDIVGRTVLVDGRPHVVGGVLPPEFTDAEGTGCYLPLPLSPDPSDGEADVRDLQVTARFRDDADIAAVRVELQELARRLAHARPATHADWSVTVESLWDARFARWRTSFTAGLLALSALTFLALINVSHLAYAYVAQRGSQFTLMAVLGARLSDLVRAYVVQSAGPLGVGVSAGLVLALWGHRLLLGLVSTDLPARHPIVLTAAASAITTLACAAIGCVAALTHTIRVVARAQFSLATGRVPGLGRDGRWRHALIVCQTAMAVVLGVLSAGTISILMHQYQRWQQMASPHLLLAEVHLPIGQYRKRSDVALFFERLTALLQERPGVHAAVIERQPFDPPMFTRVFMSGRRESVTARHHAISSNSLSLLQLRLVAGRPFAPADRYDALGVVLLNVDLAERMFGGSQQALHRRIVLTAEGNTEYQVVGVVDDRARPSATEVERVAVYRPFAQLPLLDAVVAIQGPQTAAQLRAAIPQAVATLDPSVAVPVVSTMMELRDRAFRSERVTVLLLLGGAVIAGLVSLAGLYALTSLVSFSRRTELMVRSALGATPTDLVRLVARSGLALTGAGVLLGLLGSYVVGALTAVAFSPGTLSASLTLAVSAIIGVASAGAVLWPAARLSYTPAGSHRSLH